MGVEIEQQAPEAAPFKIIVLVAAIAAGVQFGWALQLSLLTPYVQLLGVPHMWSAFIWLCGPISGLTVQPIVGYYSDRCTSSFGRRRPFIAAGAALVLLAVFFIGFAADLGHVGGDPLAKGTKPRAIALFVIGFWILDVANNTLQGPCRALLADLSSGNPRKMSTSNALFSFFMAVGNILGYSAGSYTHLYKVFPFAKTEACDVYCANLKSCFIISIALLATITALALTFVREAPFDPAAEPERNGTSSMFGELFGALKNLPRPMWILMLVTAVAWIAWFPFLLYDTDWMGKEVYGGKVGEGNLYDRGVRAGALGLMLNSVVLGVASLGLQFCAREGVVGVKKLWGAANFLLAIGLAMMVVITKVAEHKRRFGADGAPLPPEEDVKILALSLFAFLCVPLAALFSIPFALASIFSSSTGSGQGLSLGVLNLSIVIPQMVVSVLSGPWDNLFGGGNLPAFIAGAVAAIISGVLALKMLPSLPSEAVAKASTGGGFH